MDILRFKGKGTEITHVSGPACLIDSQSKRVFLRGKYTEQNKRGQKDARLVDIPIELHLSQREAEDIADALGRLYHANPLTRAEAEAREPGQEG